jgi:hypothetical protein
MGTDFANSVRALKGDVWGCPFSTEVEKGFKLSLTIAKKWTIQAFTTRMIFRICNFCPWVICLIEILGINFLDQRLNI